MKTTRPRLFALPVPSVLLAIAIFAAAPNAHALVVLSNLPGSGNYTGGSITLGTTSWEAVGLKMGTTSADFTSFTGYFDSFQNHTLQGGIFSDNAGQPGSSLISFTPQSVNSVVSPTAYTLTTATAYTLQANTSYWFVLWDPPSYLDWDRDTSNTAPSAASGFTFNGYMRSVNSGSTWSADTTGNWTVEVQVVPEPSSAMLLLAGVCGMTLRSRARRKS
jgi:hypothetical protein